MGFIENVRPDYMGGGYPIEGESIITRNDVPMENTDSLTVEALMARVEQSNKAVAAAMEQRNHYWTLLQERMENLSMGIRKTEENYHMLTHSVVKEQGIDRREKY